MMKKIKLYRSAVRSPYFNLAAEEYLVKNADADSLTLFLWQNDSTVVIGKNQNCYAECDTARLISDGGRLARRLSGGGAVWHDGGNLCFSFIADEKNYNVQKQLSAVVCACSRLGISAEASGRNDITVGGLKFSGNSFYRQKNICCHHGTVLISGDLGRLSEYLTVSREKLAAKGIASVYSRVTNLSAFCNGLTAEDFASELTEAVRLVYGLELPCCEYDLPDEQIIRDRIGFFGSDGWLYGENPDFTDELSGRFPWGGVTLRLAVSGGKIQRCTVYSDSLDTDLPDRVSSALDGAVYSRSGALAALQGLPCGVELAALFDRL